MPHRRLSRLKTAFGIQANRLAGAGKSYTFRNILAVDGVPAWQLVCGGIFGIIVCMKLVLIFVLVGFRVLAVSVPPMPISPYADTEVALSCKL